MMLFQCQTVLTVVMINMGDSWEARCMDQKMVNLGPNLIVNNSGVFLVGVSQLYWHTLPTRLDPIHAAARQWTNLTCILFHDGIIYKCGKINKTMIPPI